MNKKRNILLISSLIVFFGFLLGTSPYKLPLLLILVPGIALIIILRIVVSMVLEKLLKNSATQRIITNVVTAVVAVAAILLSVGQFTFRDFSLLLAFALIGVFYVSRLKER